MWSRNNHVVIDGLRCILIRLWVEFQPFAQLINPAPKLAPINRQHDVPNSLGLNNILLNEVVDEFDAVSIALFHIILVLHFKNINKFEYSTQNS